MPKQDFAINCIKCGTKLDGFTATEHDQAKPETGNVSLCFYCQNIMIFWNEDGDLSKPPDMVRRPTDEEVAEIMTQGDVLRAIDAMEELKRKEPWIFLRKDDP